VADVLHDLSERVKALGSDWTKYTVVGSFLLYVVGYLSLRFHLTAIGIGTDLAVLDERYLFAGARFLVYLVSSVPNIVLVALPLAVMFWVVCKLLPEAARASARAWIMQPTRLAVFGIVFAVIMIQLVMRQCFVFSDLLLANALPTEAAWLVKLLLDDGRIHLYFSLMVAACAVPLAILVALRKREAQGGSAAFTRGLLAFLAAVQVLLLPINYGVLIADKVMPRVAAIGDKPLADGEDAWLVWEGKEGVTFLHRSREQKRRALVTLPRTKIERMEILGFDRILPTLFGTQKGGKG
jgi:hypothetical protein